MISTIESSEKKKNKAYRNGRDGGDDRRKDEGREAEESEPLVLLEEPLGADASGTEK